MSYIIFNTKPELNQLINFQIFCFRLFIIELTIELFPIDRWFLIMARGKKSGRSLAIQWLGNDKRFEYLSYLYM